MPAKKAASPRVATTDNSRPRPLRQLRLAFGFFTVLPLSSSGSLEEVAAAGYLLPLVGGVLGSLEGLAGWGSVRVAGPSVAGAIVLCAALLLTGLHHADGLADVGDAVMVHGDAFRRLEVLKDKSLGVGAAGALLMTYLLTWTALAQFFALGSGVTMIFYLAAAEVCARLGLLLTAAWSRPSHAGSGAEFIKVFRGWRGAGAIAAAVIILAALIPPVGLAAVGAAAGSVAVVALLLSAMSKRLFGGAGGDVLGASVELSRMAALLALVLVAANL